MRPTARAVATDPVAHAAATAYLEAGGDAVGAAVSGYFAAAATHPGVLLGPAVLMMARVGGGVRAFDGRPRQPGLGLRRRKGYSSANEAPIAARAAVPTGLAALLVALRYGQGFGLAKVVSPGVSIARKDGCERRAEALEAIQRLGASALADPLFRRALLHAAGPTEGGLLTDDDLRAVPVVDHPASAQGRRFTLPWNGEEISSSPASTDESPALVALDAGGGIATLGYSNHSGIALPELELELPLAAIPAQKGVTRVPAGQVLPWSRTLTIQLADNGAPEFGAVSTDNGHTLKLTPEEEAVPRWNDDPGEAH